MKQLIIFFLLIPSLNSFSQLSLTVTSTNPTCDYDNGIIVAKVSGGTPPYSFASNKAQQSNYTGVFTQLSAGTYDLRVVDATGTSSQDYSVTLTTNYPHPYILKYDAVNPSGCLSNDGKITLTGGGGQSPYMYSNNNGISFQTSNVFTGLAPGLHQIFIKDANGCISAPWSGNNLSYLNYQYYFLGIPGIPLESPGCAMNISGLYPFWACGNEGYFSFFYVKGGNAPYSFSFDGINYVPNPPSSIFGGLAPGKYILYYKDATGITNNLFFNIPPSCPLLTIITGTLCGMNNGTITITKANGIAPFTYSIDGTNFQANNSFINLKAGAYTVIARDVNGATGFQNIVVPDGCPQVNVTTIAASCGNNNGSISAIGSKGTPPYKYSINNITFQASGNFLNLNAGSYTVYVKDASNFTNTASILIADNCPQISAISTNEFCGKGNGTITVKGSGGTAPFQFSLDGINFQSTTVFNNLIAKTYVVTIKDALGATNKVQVVLTNISAPQLTATTNLASCMDNDGMITVTAFGGSSPFLYSINGTDFQQSNVFYNLKSGAYLVWVKDSNGCMRSISQTVNLNNNLSIKSGNSATICEGESKTISVLSNGTGINWKPSAGLSNITIVNPVASPIVTTKYYITATLGICNRTDSIIVYVSASPKAVAEKSAVICFGQSIQINGSGGVLYAWNPATYLDNPKINNPVVFKPQKSMDYSLKVKDSLGCQSLNEAIVNITVTPPVKIFAGNDTSIISNQPFQLRGVDVNNSGITKYFWSPAIDLNNPLIQTPILITDHDATYTLTASTVSGCEGNDDINIKVFKGPEIYVPNAFTPNGDGINDILKAVPIGISKFKYFSVYNRYGEKVFYTTDPNIGWKGDYTSAGQSMNVFIWIAEGIDGQGSIIYRKGTVILTR